MNELMGTLNIVNQHSSTQYKLNENEAGRSWNRETNGNPSFFQTLQQSVSSQLAKEASETLHVSKANERLEMDVDVEKLLNLLSQLSLEEEMLDISMLEENMNSELLAQIPNPFKEELIVLFDQQIPLEELVTESSLDNPIQLLAIVMAFVHAEQQSPNDTQGGSQRVLALLQDHLQHHFPLQINDKENMNWSKIVEKLTESLKQIQKDSNTDSTIQFRSWLGSLSEKSNEREIASSVYERLFQSSNGNKSSNTVVSLDTTNSHMARLQQFFIHSGEQQTSKPSEQQFLRQFQNILARSQFQNLGNGLQQLTVKLHPESLGKLDITIQQINGVIVAKMMTTTAVAKELIESQLHQLRHAFQAQQLQVDRIEITQQQTQQQQFKEQEQEHEAHEQNREQGNENKEDAPEEESFSTYLEETINMEV